MGNKSKKQPPACSRCHRVALAFFERFGSDDQIRPAERRQVILQLAIAVHRQRRCWEGVQDKVDGVR